jgi:hypothetical protein
MSHNKHLPEGRDDDGSVASCAHTHMIIINTIIIATTELLPRSIYAHTPQSGQINTDANNQATVEWFCFRQHVTIMQ